MRTRNSPKRGCRSGAGIACTAALCCALSASAQGPGTKGVSPKRDASSAPTSGTVVSYQESRGTGILYLEETGGMTSGVASPTKLSNGSADVPALASTPVAARKAPTGPNTVAQGLPAPAAKRP